MDHLKLKAFLMCCEEMNYTKAAERLFISRQALRQTIKAMEAELNTELFENRRNRLFLTMTGEILRKYAQQQIDGHASLMAELQAAQGEPMRIGISCSLLPYCTPELPGFLEEFEANHPKLHIELSSCTPDQAVEQVRSGELTVAVVSMMQCDLPGIETDALFAAPVGVTFAAAHPFARREQIGIADLEGECCAVWGAPELVMKPLADALARAGIAPRFEVIPTIKAALYRMETGNCVMIEYTYPNTKKLQVERNLPLAGGGFCWDLTLLYGAQKRTPSVAALRDFLLERYNDSPKMKHSPDLKSKMWPEPD